MKRLISFLSLFIILFAVFGCGGGGGSGGAASKESSSSVTIATHFQTAHASGMKQAASKITNVRYTISGPGMQPITGIAPVINNLVEISLIIPNGSQRHFVIEAMDKNNNMWYQGEAYSDLDGTPVTVDITLNYIGPPQESAISIILTWGANPPDLDAHLTGPLQDGTRFHMYYLLAEDMYGTEWPDYVTLDVDDDNGFGPETIILSQQIDGLYRFSVHDSQSSGNPTSTALSNSGAQVQVYKGSYLLETFTIPTNQIGNLWTVFEMDGNTITPVNTLTNQSDEEQIQTIHGKTDAMLIRNLPKKSKSK
jgi:hypothetical protein